MTDLLNNLESQIESLLLVREQLKAENHSLRQKLSKLLQERATLAEKNQQAANKVKRVISQLRNEIP
jgi:cell division protein ZapB